MFIGSSFKLASDIKQQAGSLVDEGTKLAGNLVGGGTKLAANVVGSSSKLAGNMKDASVRFADGIKETGVHLISVKQHPFIALLLCGLQITCQMMCCSRIDAGKGSSSYLRWGVTKILSRHRSRSRASKVESAPSASAQYEHIQKKVEARKEPGGCYGSKIIICVGNAFMSVAVHGVTLVHGVAASISNAG